MQAPGYEANAGRVMSAVPAGLFFGGESEEEDGGFDFGDSPAEDTGREFVEPSLAAVSASSGKESPSTTHAQIPLRSSNPSSPRKSPGGFGLPPKLTNQNRGRGPDGRRGARERQRGGRGPSKGVWSLEEGEEVRVAMVRGRREEVARMLESGFDVNTVLRSGWTALMYACDQGSESMVELLLNHGANPNTQKDLFSALMAVCLSQCQREESLASCARLLINKGARVNAHDRHHMSPLLYACQSGRCSLVQVLISTNADVNKQDSRGWTPLSYAASLGNTRLAQLLLDASANPTLMTNSGETPATIAYAHGHTALADMLEHTLSRGFESRLPPHPLVVGGGLAQEENSTGAGVNPSSSSATCIPVSTPHPNPHSRPPASSTSDCVRYGDLELFLFGLQLGEQVSLFQAHRVTFANLLSMTDRDLEQMGVSQVGVRKRILDGILDVHKRQWDMPKQAVPYNKCISSSEAAVILSHLAKHASYIKGTASFLLTHAQSNPDMLDPNMEPAEAEKLTNHLSEAVAAVSSLQGEVEAIRGHIQSVLGRETQERTDKAAIVRPTRRRVFTLMKLVGAVAVLGCVVYFGGRELVKRWDTLGT